MNPNLKEFIQEILGEDYDKSEQLHGENTLLQFIKMFMMEWLTNLEYDVLMYQLGDRQEYPLIDEEEYKNQLYLALRKMRHPCRKEEFMNFYFPKSKRELHSLEDEGGIEEVNKDTKIEDIDLSVRAINVLKRANINTVYELMNTPMIEILNLRNMGLKAFKNVLKTISKVKHFNFKDSEN